MNHPALAPAPAKLFVEPTSRCNMRCRMCLREAPGSVIPQADLDPALFAALSPLFSGLSQLVISGLGEPLLHPELAGLVALARRGMPDGAEIGLQSNALLLTEARATELLAAGLSSLCISVDSVSGAAACGEIHGAGQLRTLETAFAAVDAARRRLRPEGLRLGVQFVLMADTFTELPAVLDWAAARGADFALVSHVLPYSAESLAQSLFNPNTGRSLELLARFRRIAAARGLDLDRAFAGFWTFRTTERQRAEAELVKEMLAAALAEGVPCHLGQLLAWRERAADALEAVLAEAEAVAARTGLTLKLPAHVAATDRRCGFMEDGGMFVAASGEVHPCYFQWHEYDCRVGGAAVHVLPRTFGNLAARPALAIWNDPDYVAFRRQALGYDYPHCANCAAAPCSDIDGRPRPFEADCYGQTVPCGFCPWCTGGVQCLS